MSNEVSRRRFFKTAAALPAAAGLTSAPAASQPLPGVAPLRPLSAPAEATRAPYFFFTEPEAETVRAIVARLIPADNRWPGAVEAGCVAFIDRQLAGAYGNGERMYLQGPWEEGTPEQGYQLPYTPAQVYRIGLDAMSRFVRERFGRSFAELDGNFQERVLQQLESGEAGFPELPSAMFFETLLANTIEGFFADPMYGGNRDMMAWRMIGFPGPYASYLYLVDHWGIRYDRAPMSIAEAVVAGHKHD